MNNRDQKHTPNTVRRQAKVLRKRSTPAEMRLWAALRNHQLNGLKFRRQHPLGPFIADFYCAEYRLVVEVDGGIHNFTVEEDQARDQAIQEHGYRIIRFQNKTVEENLTEVLSAILDACHPLSQNLERG